MKNQSGKNSRTNKRRGYAINVLVIVILVAGIRGWQQRDMISGAAPALHGETLTDLPYILPAHPERPVLVHFWATWCPICRAEQGSIAAIARGHADVITVAMQSGGIEEVSRHMREQGLDFPVLNDPDGRLSSAWGVPASFIASPDGRISFVEVGYTTGIGLRLILWLAGI